MTDPRQPDHAALLKRALAAIDQLEAKVAANERARTEPIAVVGMGCRFPQGANSPEAFWDLLRDGVDTVTEVPAHRWDVDAVYDPDPDATGKSYTRWGAFIDNVDRFDAAFFGVSPREAVSMDPQQRILLEVTWEALEHAAIAPSSLAGSQTAVYVGITTHDYAMELAEAVGSRHGDAYSPSGTAHSVAAGRLSYVLGLHGPNVAIDTACSSSLVALHWAVQSLRRRECDTALAGGVNLTLTADGSVLTSRARMMSFDGHCKTFDASADGYVRGEGCGMLVLKRLADAQRDGDRVLAVVRGSALNQDGRSSGLTAPNGQAQEAVIKSALANAQLKPGDVSMIEAHGTGTPLGDPIEIKALNAVYGNRTGGQKLKVGSVKTNIGHLEAAAGIAGVIKTVLALQHRTVPPHLHFQQPNPLIDWAHIAIEVPTALAPWDTPAGQPRRAGVSSFGFSGTNAHVLLEEAPPIPSSPTLAPSTDPQVLMLSAQTPAALAEVAAQLAERLAQPDPPALPEVAATLALGRSHLIERAAFVATDLADARARLSQLAAGDATGGIAVGRVAGSGTPEVVFMFSGQGTQYQGMARALYEAQPVFRTALDACARHLAGDLPRPLLDVVFGDAAALDDTAFTQPALFAVEFSLAALWRHWGLEPTTVMGHSVGEYVAACVAGVFTMPDALRLIAARARLMSRLPRDGGMAAAFADLSTVSEALRGHEAQVAVAATNGPQNTVISGRIDALEAVLARLGAAGVETQRLNVSHAFHSPLMTPMLEEFERMVAATPMARPRIGLVSNLTGRLADAELCEASYWRRHVREAVRFAESIATLQQDGHRVFVEVGPSPTLLGMAQRCTGAADCTWVGSLRKSQDDRLAMLDAAARLHVRGVALDWAAVLGEASRRRRVPLPRYPFQRERYWHVLDGGLTRSSLAALQHAHPLLRGTVPSPVPIFQGNLGVGLQPWLRDHRIFGFTLFPGTGFLELAVTAARELGCGDAAAVQSLELREALALPDDAERQVQVVAMTQADGRHALQIHSRSLPADDTDASAWRLHASCFVGPAAVGPESAEPAKLDLAMLRARVSDTVDVASYYERLRDQGAEYGAQFRALAEIRRTGTEVLARLQLPPEATSDAARMQLHPALLDACLQLVGVGIDWQPDAGVVGDDLCVPTGMAEYRLWRSGAAQGWCHVKVLSSGDDPDVYRADLLLCADDGSPIARLRGLELRRTTRASLERLLGAGKMADWLFEPRWQPAPMADTAGPVPRSEGCWLLAADGSGLTRALAQQLRATGASVIEVRHGPETMLGESGWTLDEADVEQWRSAIETIVQRNGRPLQGIVSLRALDVKADERDIVALEAAQRGLLGATLALAKAVAETEARFWFVTRGAQALGGAVPDLAQAPAWGLAGVIASELTAQKLQRIDLDPEPRDDEADLLIQSVVAPDLEDRVALRAGQRQVARLVVGDSRPRLPEAPLRLEITERGTLENLKLLPVAREAPGAGQVEIRVHATGLNFRDVLNALGMYPGDPGPLGNECAGVVTAVGEGVDEFAVGDEVVSMVDRSFATWVLAPAALTVRKPDSMSFADAATVPVTFLTAQYALRDLARIKLGDRVLIHAITGGVGMAALQIALRAGAEVFGTAGTPAKRALARHLGAHHVSDSRSLSFAADVRSASGGEGVDIVLNSLAADFIPESLRLLRPGGHFIEIGKTGIWDAARVAREFPGVHYHPLYLGEVAAARPRFVRDMLDELLADIGRGELSALPLRCWPLDEAESAFRFMGQGHHTGKIVITQAPAPTIRADASYLVTGGLGGLGLVFAQWLAEGGARHLVLMGRRPPGEVALAAIESLRQRGVAVDVVAADVADGEAVAALWRRTGRPPIRGILHAAGTVDDGMLAALDISRFDAVMAPKVRGTWNLHQQSLRAPLDFFVMFSSGAALLGSPGQGNYAAANTFMDALAFGRRARGMHALSINWGSWSGAGMAADVDDAHRRRWAALGLAMIEPAQGVQMLQQLLMANRHAQAAALPLVRTRLPAGLPPFYSLLQHARPASAGPVSASAEAAVDLAPRLRAGSPAERLALLREFLTHQLVKVLALGSREAVDPHRSLMALGMDSLMAMELRNRVQSATQLRVAVADLLKGASVEHLAGNLAAQLPPSTGAAADPAIEQVWEEGSL
jgi:acyl transferase domain-containing protein/NAD(P)-dependent dehydrogenase (short-subunit alcohol dehydrogenase family)/aryl carrier-like protein